jgi:hypothetical protein
MSDTNFILTPEQAESLLLPGERVHSFVNPPWGFVGCDSTRKAVIRLIREAKLLEIGGEHAKRMKHALVVHASFLQPTWRRLRRWSGDWRERRPSEPLAATHGKRRHAAAP